MLKFSLGTVLREIKADESDIPKQTFEKDDQQNKNMQFLTVISTIFFPLTLVTGWFGMNFKNMPELEHGYPFVIVGSLIIVAVIIWIFKKKKIM